MSATGQTIAVESLSDYTRLWSELIDRGGLYHINDEVYNALHTATYSNTMSFIFTLLH